jgi:hypothetical protein
MGCSNLTTVTIEGAVITTIGDKAFHGCQKLGDFELPNSLTSIGEEAFRNCEKFTSVTIPAGCTLGDGAFVWCTQLKTATINSDIDIPSRCFQNCGNLERVITTTTNNIGYSAFSNCVNLTEVPVTNELTTIYGDAFNGCSKLTNLMLSDGGALTTIDYNAFKNCTSVTMVSLPATIETINVNAFTGCTALADVYCLKTTTPVPVIFENTFGGRENSIKLHVTNPTDYQNNTNWSKFQIVTLAKVTLSFYVNGVIFKDITDWAGTKITKANPKDSLEAALLDEGDTKEEFSGWDKAFPETMPSTDTRFDGYVTTTTTIDHFKYSLRPAQTINEIAYGNRAVLLGAEEGHITQSNNTVTVPETVTNCEGTYNKTAYPVIAIADNAFEIQGELASVELTANITELGVSAFKGCSKLESINLIAVLEDSIVGFFDNFSNSDRQIIFNHEGNNCQILSNKIMLLRVFDNIIGNAYKHGKGALTIDLDTETKHITFRNEIADDENLTDAAHVFDEFYTTDVSRTKGSTGLGLAIAKQFILILGGRISAEARDYMFTISIDLEK